MTPLTTSRAPRDTGIPTISVVIDAYNQENFIEQAISSVLSQDFSADEMEIIAVDDGSTDRTGKIIQEFAPRVRLIQKENGGQASAFSAGIAEARGEFVALLDGDDYWLPGKLTRILQEFRKSPEAGMVYHGFFWASNGQLRDAKIPGSSGFISASLKSLLSYELRHPTCTLAFRRTILQRLLPVPEPLVIQADAHLFATVIFLAPIVYIEQPLAAYRVHEGNASLGWFAEPSSEQTPNSRSDPQTKARLYRSIVTTRAIGEGVCDWLRKNGFDPESANLRPFVMRWSFISRALEFRLSPPSRLKLSRYFLDYLRTARALMSWRLRAVNAANVLASLVVGYNNFAFLEQWPLRISRLLHRQAQYD